MYSSGVDLDALRLKLAETSTLRPIGQVKSVVGFTLRGLLPGARVGDVVRVKRRGEPLLAEIVGFSDGEIIAMPLGNLTGVGPDDLLESTGEGLQVRVGPGLLGRVLNGLGEPHGAPITGPLQRYLVEREPPFALRRRPVDQPLATGLRVIDGLMTLGRGQRVGLFAGSGVGKSTLLGAVARGTTADVVVVALVGERGREVNEFIEQVLGEAGLKRAVVVVATSDAPALERLRAAQVATSIAEYFRDEGQDVLLLVDSITRFARAQREIGLAAGEPPARRGYPPSVFAMLPRLLERSGQGERGSISAIYTVLVEGGDMDEPIADEVRGILDGHIVMEREIAARGQYPAIDVPNSLSRVMPQVAAEGHLKAASEVRKLLAAYEQKRDLISLGAYAKGSDALVDAAISAQQKILRFLNQSPTEASAFERSVEELIELAQSSRPRF